MAINNAATIIEPQAFVALDPPSRFNPLIFKNSRILKLLNYSRAFDEISGERVCRAPNTLFFDVVDETQMKMSEFCSLEGPLPFWGMTFFTAIACLYQFGFKKIYLAGCTFDTAGYSHSDQNPIEAGMNISVLEETVENMKKLVPMLVDEGMDIKTVHSSTPLDGICEYVSFEDAITQMSLEANEGLIKNEEQVAFFINQVLCNVLRSRTVSIFNKNEAIARILKKSGIKVTSEFSRSVVLGSNPHFESKPADVYIMHDIFAEMQFEEIEKALSYLHSIRKPLIFTISTSTSKIIQPIVKMTHTKWRETLQQLGSAVTVSHADQYSIFIVYP